VWGIGAVTEEFSVRVWYVRGAGAVTEESSVRVRHVRGTMGDGGEFLGEPSDYEAKKQKLPREADADGCRIVRRGRALLKAGCSLGGEKPPAL